MLVVDLHCAHGHHFEGWFASSDDLVSQQARGLVSCPVCGDHEVVRRPSAPHLNVSHLKAEPLPSAGRSRTHSPSANVGELVSARGQRQRQRSGQPGMTRPRAPMQRCRLCKPLTCKWFVTW